MKGRTWLLLLAISGCGDVNDGDDAPDDPVDAADDPPDAGPGIVLTDGVRTWADGSLAASCLAYLEGDYTGDTGDGLYRIEIGGDPVDVHCDMTTDGGGWTRVVGIDAETLAHSDPAAVAFAPDPAGVGKLSDAQINEVKSSISATTPVYRFTCGEQTVYFPGSCTFAASLAGASGDCHVFSTTYASPTWTTGTDGDHCAENSAYATLSSIVTDAPCGNLIGEINLTYRRVDWRGETYDQGGCIDVTDDHHAGAIFVK
jgi:hypothetical protein